MEINIHHTIGVEELLYKERMLEQKLVQLKKLNNRKLNDPLFSQVWTLFVELD